MTQNETKTMIESITQPNARTALLKSWLDTLGNDVACTHLLESFTGDVFCIVDADDQIVFWSNGAERRLGRTAEEVLGKKAETHLDELEREAGPPFRLKRHAHAWLDTNGQCIATLQRWLPEPVFSPPVFPGSSRDKTEVFHGIITADLSMKQALQIVRNVAETDTTILVRGESGTGKELIAKALHLESHRRNGPFQAINCAALSPHLLESELFGHVKGAFTGAIKDHPGLFKRADGGTLFLDEVAELPLELQAKLLRVLQERTFTPVGGDKPVQVDVRIIAATHRSLRQEVKAGRFREDLMYRLRVVPLFLPALRERRLDISLLLWHFIERHNTKGIRRIEVIEPEAMQVLLDYPWPGNVRELQNVVEYAFAVGRETHLTLNNLPPEFREAKPDTAQPTVDKAQAIQEALRLSGGRIDEAAHRLGMSRASFWRHRKRLGLVD